MSQFAYHAFLSLATRMDKSFGNHLHSALSNAGISAFSVESLRLFQLESDADGGELPSAHLPEDGLVPSVGPNVAKRPYYQGFPEIAILPYLGHSLKRRFVGLLSTFPISGGIKRFFP
ncbi:hypothetical protein BC332_22021 [Capsicum chinense]|nr:hypothetical protein BC332_22021 [Capsicum chinense]